MPIMFTLKHISHMTDDVGIFEHCVKTSIDRKEGYCTDDNSRALSVCLRIKGGEESEAQRLIPIYLSFLKRACNVNGFHQDLNSDLTWKDDAKADEGFGRSMISLADTVLYAEKESQKNIAIDIFRNQRHLINKVNHIRVISQNIVALNTINKTDEYTPSYKHEMILLSDELVKLYKTYSSNRWMWFEDILTYENSRIPISLFMAYQLTGNNSYFTIAKKSFDFLLNQTFDIKKNMFSFIGHSNWFPRGGVKSLYGQQPVEAGGTVEACCLAYKVTGDKKYLDYAYKAIDWYSGRNIYGISLIDNKSGGIKDGLESYGINQNEGAESILSYIQACLSLKEIK